MSIPGFLRKYTDSHLEQISSFLNNSVSEAAISKMFTRSEEELEKKEGLLEDARCLEELKGYAELCPMSRPDPNYAIMLISPKM